MAWQKWQMLCFVFCVLAEMAEMAEAVFRILCFGHKLSMTETDHLGRIFTASSPLFNCNQQWLAGETSCHNHPFYCLYDRSFFILGPLHMCGHDPTPSQWTPGGLSSTLLALWRILNPLESFTFDIYQTLLSCFVFVQFNWVIHTKKI